MICHILHHSAYHIISCHITSHLLSYHIPYHHVTSCFVIPYLISYLSYLISYHLSYHTMYHRYIHNICRFHILRCLSRILPIRFGCEEEKEVVCDVRAHFLGAFAPTLSRAHLVQSQVARASSSACMVAEPGQKGWACEKGIQGQEKA